MQVFFRYRKRLYIESFPLFEKVSFYLLYFFLFLFCFYVLIIKICKAKYNKSMDIIREMDKMKSINLLFLDTPKKKDISGRIYNRKIKFNKIK